MPGTNQQFPPQGVPIMQPFMGLFYDRPSWNMDPRAFEDCNNIRIANGRVRNDLMGWSSFYGVLNGPVTMIDVFRFASGVTRLVFGTPTDIYSYSGGAVSYITPIYNAGTVTVTNGSAIVAGSGTKWDTPLGGNFIKTLTQAAIQGATTLYLNDVSNIKVGQSVQDLTTAGSIQPQTTVLSIDTAANSLQLSLGLLEGVSVGDFIQLGGQNAGFRNNVRPGDQISFGSANVTSPTATWYTVNAVASDGSLTMAGTYPGSTASGVAYTIRQLFTNWQTANLGSSIPMGTYTNHWETETFIDAGEPWNKDMWFATNGQDCLFSWDGVSSSGSYVSSMPFTAATIRRYKNMMIYGCLQMVSGEFLPTSIANSDNALPTTMAGGVAGQYVITDQPFRINHLGVLGSVLMCYMGSDSGGSVVSASYVGYPINFAFTEVIRGRGPVSGRMVVEFPDRHQFIAPDGEYRYNGLFVQNMNTQVWRYLMENVVNYSDLDVGYAIVNELQGDCIWVPPQGNSSFATQSAWVEHYMEQAQDYLFKPYTKRDWPFTCAGFFPDISPWQWSQFTGTFNNFEVPWDNANPAGPPIMLAGDSSGNIWSLYGTSNMQGINGFSSWVRFPKRILSPVARCLVKRVYPFLELPANSGFKVQVTLSCYDTNAGPLMFNDTQEFDPTYTSVGFNGSAQATYVYRFTTHYRRGRVAQVTIGTDGCTGPEVFILDGYDWSFVPGGQR